MHNKDFFKQDFSKFFSKDNIELNKIIHNVAYIITSYKAEIESFYHANHYIEFTNLKKNAGNLNAKIRSLTDANANAEQDIRNKDSQINRNN